VELFESIVEGGGLLLSEFPTRFPPLAANFPRRNRIISGLSLTVVVVEAGLTSGALVTARHAIDDHQREPCAVPGPVDSPRSAGCNAAIRDGWAQCVLDPGDVLAMVEASAERLGRRAAAATSGDRLEALGVPPTLRDAVSRAAGLLARRPRIGDAELAADLGMAPSAVAAVRTFASLAAAPGQVQPMA
jgi:DNA processing protein